MIHLLLLTTLLIQERVQVSTGAIVIRIAGEASPDLRRGVEFGIAEMTHTAGLMRRQVILASDSSSEATAVIVATASAPIPAGETVVRIHVNPLPSGAESCEFSVAAPDSKTDRSVAAWHPALSKYGASELNERFDRKYISGMSDAAYLGWVAVKALVEAELRRKPDEDYCRVVATLRFDGHKGRQLFFDPATRTLSQPLYFIKDGKVIGETK
jgi:hypothetical protein